MADYNNIPKGLKLTTQIPLDVKTYVADEATLAYLGTGDNLAYTYYDGLRVFCIAERNIYEWREVKVGEANTGLVALDFTYPSGLTTFGINYSGKKYNFFKVRTVQGFNDSVSIDINSTSPNVSLEIKENLQPLGSGTSVYNGFDNTTKKHKIKGIKSNTLSITNNTDDVNIEIPELGANTIYVNNKYTGGSSNGSKTKPYTTVASAVTGYIGTGTRLAPEKAGYVLYIERGNGTYDETNLNLTIKGLIFYLERDTAINATNASNWLFDLDSGVGATFGYNHTEVFYIYGIINLYGNGFRSSGTNSTGTYTNTSSVELRGSGRIDLRLTPAEISSDPTLQRYTLISAGKVNPLNQNGQLTTFVINDVTLYSASQRIIDLGGQVIQLNYVTIASSYDSDIILSDYKGILITGGSFRASYGSIGGSGTVTRTALIHVEGNQTSLTHPYHQPSLELRNVVTSGGYLNFISYKHNAIPSFDFSGKILIINMSNSYLLADSLLYNQSGTISTFDIKNCVLPGFPRLKNTASLYDVKIYPTASNVIGAYIIDTLPEYPNYTAAVSALLPAGAKFTNTNENNADKNTWKTQTV